MSTSTVATNNLFHKSDQFFKHCINARPHQNTLAPARLFEGLDGGGGGYKFQLSVKTLAICQLSVKFKAICQLRFNTLCEQNRRKLVCPQTGFLAKSYFLRARESARGERQWPRSGRRKEYTCLSPRPPPYVRALSNPPRFLFSL